MALEINKNENHAQKQFCISSTYHPQRKKKNLTLPRGSKCQWRTIILLFSLPSSLHPLPYPSPWCGSRGSHPLPYPSPWCGSRGSGYMCSPLLHVTTPCRCLWSRFHLMENRRGGGRREEVEREREGIGEEESGGWGDSGGQLAATCH